MGKVRPVGLGVDCDRCGQFVSVPDALVSAYKTISEGGGDEGNEPMFAALLLSPVSDGTAPSVSVAFEYLCPACVDAVNKYLGKIGGKTTETVEKAPAAKKPTTKKSAPAEARVEAPVKEPAKETTKPGIDVDDNDFYDK